MALYIPHSIFHLTRLLYVRPETFGPCYVRHNFGSGIMLSQDLSVSCLETGDCKSWTMHTFNIACRSVLYKNTYVSADFIRKLA
jgi:hypothetical protein